jgi:general secretion pathway protein H
MVLVAFVAGAVIMGSGQLSGSRLRQSATGITGAIRVAYTRATATSKSLRLVMDLEQQTLWLEEASAPMLVQSGDTTGTGGADPVTAAEKAAVAEGERILSPKVAAPRSRFRAIEVSGVLDSEAAKGPKHLARGITFGEVQASHDEKPRTSGRAYLYFWPGGLTERAAIQLRIGTSIRDNDTLTLLVSPLTGKVTVKSGAVALTRPEDDRAASEREDRGL